jgi:hypothetical protein
MSRVITLTDQKVYLICNGTSTNKVIDSINDNIKEKRSFFSTFFSKKNNKNNIKKINYEEFPRLENIGIKECYICKESRENLNLFKNELSYKNASGYNYVFTSLEYNSIESAMILFSDIPDLVICPLPYMSNKTNIKNIESFDNFKKNFGKYSLNSKREISKLKEYWNQKELNTKFNSIKNKDQIIDWLYTSNINRSSLSSYNSSLFQKKFEELLLTKYVNVDDVNDKISNNIFVCNDQMISDILNFKNKDKKKYNILSFQKKTPNRLHFDKKKNNIEVTSIWELSVSIEFKINSSNKIIDKKIIYNNNYNKIYPTQFNPGELEKKRNIDKYSYSYDNSDYILFNSVDKIPLKYLKNMNFRSYNDDKKNIIQKIIEKNKKNNKDSKNVNKNEQNEKNKKASKYENLV